MLRFLLPTAAIGLLASASCGPSLGSICEQREACLGGNDKDIEACEASFDTADSLAGDIGCGSEFDDYFSCFEDSATCGDQPTGGVCLTDTECALGGQEATCVNGQCTRKGYDIQDPDTCKAEREAYNECFDF